MLLNRFAKDRNGNVATMFALAIVPIIGFVGAAVDFSRAATARSALQSALDSTALTLSKEAAGLTAAQLTQKATEYVTQMFNRPEAKSLAVTVNYTKSPSSLTVGGSASLDSTFMKILGIQKMDIGSSTTVNWGATKLRVALALDTTGSMSDFGKMPALKTATKQLLTLLKDASGTPGDVQVAIVPFSKTVNVGKGYYNADWLDWEDWDDDNGHDAQTCTTTKIGKNGKTKKKCSTAWIPDNHNTWNGCVADRDRDFDVKNTGPNVNDPKTLFPTEQYDGCPSVAIKPLSNDWAALNATVDLLTPDGNTNQGIGLAWAWQIITPGSVPFNVAPLPPDTQPVIILVSDGLNTENRWFDNQEPIDARQAIACGNIKATGIQIYTVLIMAGNSTVLKNCATKPEMYFAVTSTSGVVTTFNQIGTSLAKLRIAK